MGFVQKESFNEKFNESKLSHETDYHRFDEYKRKKPLWKHLGTAPNSRYHEKHTLGVLPRTHSLTHRNGFVNLFYF